MTRFGLFAFSILTAAACGAQSGAGTPDDPQDDGGVEPEPAECERTEDCAADEVCTDGSCVRPAEPLSLRIVERRMRDERGDTITFTDATPARPSGPRHVHAGELVALHADECAQVYKYPYLLDEQPALANTEDEANPITWQFEVEGTDRVPVSEYRVYTEDRVLLDWAPFPADAGGNFVIPVYRSGARGIPELAGLEGRVFIDFRVEDDLARTAQVTGCWDHHVLAPPLEVAPLAPSDDNDALDRFRLSFSSPVSRLINAGTAVEVFRTRVTHFTAEPVKVRLDVPTPTGEFTKLVVNDLIPESTVTTNLFCGITCRPNTACVPEPASDPRCATATPTEPIDPTISGTLGPEIWFVSVRDAVTGQPAQGCTFISARVVECRIPGRSFNGPEQGLVVEVLTAGHAELAPGAGTTAEHVFQGINYTGLPVTERKFRCDSISIASANEFGEQIRSCTRLTTFAKLTALDQLILQLAPPKLKVETALAPSGALPGTALALPPNLPPVIVGQAYIWDSGNDDLPGPQH